ncbi:glycoside hydrolase family 9 protein [Andreprevotia chitinilytica]|uniref:glycoside hydrolase family 9 protein n=1 Tax=Andreprevotia chitinilytica TaxID=396808 RepID=UPI000552F48C|nr:glycoside hydrolase family 9 protein [Andreprevotia chitinilytica]
MKVLLNHLGFEPGSKKTALVKAPAGFTARGFTIYNAETRESVFVGQLGEAKPVANWGATTGSAWLFRTADFSALTAEGEYFIAIDGVSPPLVSHTFAIKPKLLGTQLLSDIVHYIKGQRCTGLYDIADRSRPKWGSDECRDVHGGWYDASGDCSKYLSHLSYAQYMNPQQTPIVVWNLIDGLARLPQQLKWFNERMVDEALHGADYLIRMQDPAGYFYMTVFDVWSKDENRRDICEYKTQKGEKFATYQAAYRQGGGVSIAALARASQLGRDGEDFTRADYLAAARKGFAHLEAHNIEYLEDGVENIIDDYCALLAATELLAITGEGDHADAATRRVLNLLERQNDEGWFSADAHGERSFFHAAESGLLYIALLRYLEVVPASPLAGRIRDSLRRAYAFELKITHEINNPFGYPRQYVKQIGKAGKNQFFIPHDNESGYWWQGENARLGSIAAAAARTADFFAGEDQAFADMIAAHGDNALNWLLGANPFDACMLQGWGRNNPRYEEGYFNAPGGVCNGITGGFDDDQDIAFPSPAVATMAHSWRFTEQWMPHGAWLFLAVCSRQE